MLHGYVRDSASVANNHVLMQVLRLGNIVPDFKAETTQGPMEWHKWIDGKWAILFSHPADFTVSPARNATLTLRSLKPSPTAPF